MSNGDAQSSDLFGSVRSRLNTLLDQGTRLDADGTVLTLPNRLDALLSERRSAARARQYVA
jgi:hypothetical protein